MDPEQKDELILVIEKLLSDKTTLVVGSAVMAFEEVRLFIIHYKFSNISIYLIYIFLLKALLYFLLYKILIY